MWPDDLSTLVNASRWTLKVELWKSLGLTKKEEQRAKRIVAAKVAETTGLIKEARSLLARGPLSAMSDEDIAAIAARVHADRLAQDEQLRQRALAFTSPAQATFFAFPLRESGSNSKPTSPA
ncbi:hypothetical protein [Bradyrhizobium sp. CCBAU 051011]|uniref:hypothetical protein n=1 Tax=Bradyrhizobium sp. CCBAU 051011 TaxID=858422 RepID=UPI00137953E1|nr:hypothetical protein [Bradyrhizobium sp. CCBAU 051011]